MSGLQFALLSPSYTLATCPRRSVPVSIDAVAAARVAKLAAIQAMMHIAFHQQGRMAAIAPGGGEVPAAQLGSAVQCMSPRSGASALREANIVGEFLQSGKQNASA